MLTLHMLPVGGKGLKSQAYHPEPTLLEVDLAGLQFPHVLIYEILSYGKVPYVAMSYMTAVPVASGSHVFQSGHKLCS